MTKQLFRFISLSLIFCCLLSLLSCSSGYKPIEPSKDDIHVVGTVAGHDVHWDEFRFVTITHVNAMKEKYGDGIFEGEDAERFEDELRSLVYESITANYAVLELCRQANINRGEAAVIEEVNEKISQIVDELGGMSEYKKYLAENSLTDNFLRFSVEIQLLQGELMYVYRDDLGIIASEEDDVYDAILNEFAYVHHIFIPHTDDDAYDKISEALTRLQSGDSFDALMSEYGKDSNMNQSGLLIPQGYMTEEYDAAVFSISLGTTGIVRDDLGYYIIRRSEISPMAVMEDLANLTSLYQSYALISLIDEMKDSLEFIPYPLAEDTILSDIK
ncbi:MAG: peptidylprolyl isomerase [Clostridia bacterium]|nr:peptidylprolyl isomerase [Clostridia bacterium]